MKKILLFCTVLIFTACSDDFPMREGLEGTPGFGLTAETPPEGLKLKSIGGLFSSQYYYHENGFVDSIYKINTWQGDVFTKKFIYNNLNQIIEVHSNEELPYAPDYNQKQIAYYTYNSVNQIISSITYDKNNVAIKYYTYSYNDDGTLLNPNKIIEKENLVREGSVKYQFDNTRNPVYNIYPKAYRLINYISKNNIIVTETDDEVLHIHTLKYNNENYIIEEHISNMPLDSDDRRGFSYY